MLAADLRQYAAAASDIASLLIQHDAFAVDALARYLPHQALMIDTPISMGARAP